MTPLPSTTARLSRAIKNIALFCLLTGFALELGGGVTSDERLFRAGFVLFFIGLPLLFLGIFVGRRKP